ncbi:MAG: carbamoyl-phosphate synthase small subunit [Proteobacteria bacterium]|nr:carbamoyl-phosphate synthase small subunit [Pseudomonadota bacterium]
MAEPHSGTPARPLAAKKNAVLILADGKTFSGFGIGKEGTTLAEICFNTAITGYQEILTDPSYAGQIVTFTFPHIGNVGTNVEDTEAKQVYANGLVIRAPITNPSNFRSSQHLNDWLIKNNLTGISGVDTRALTAHIRDHGAQNAAIVFDSKNAIDIEAVKKQLKAHPSMVGMELAAKVSTKAPYEWNEKRWALGKGFVKETKAPFHVVAIDYGVKLNILRCLASAGCRITVVPANTSAKDILAYNPDGVFLSNGPGDPAATGKYSIPVIKDLLDSNIPMLGICLGHQMLGIALGCKTEKMKQGHHGANHPVKDLETGKVEITSQNHGFAISPKGLPSDVIVTHISLFDQTVQGIRVKNSPVFSVQGHPEASPGPQDTHYLFERFVDLMKENPVAAKAKKEVAR